MNLSGGPQVAVQALQLFVDSGSAIKTVDVRAPLRLPGSVVLQIEGRDRGTLQVSAFARFEDREELVGSEGMVELRRDELVELELVFDPDVVVVPPDLAGEDGSGTVVVFAAQGGTVLETRRVSATGGWSAGANGPPLLSGEVVRGLAASRAGDVVVALLTDQAGQVLLKSFTDSPVPGWQQQERIELDATLASRRPFDVVTLGATGVTLVAWGDMGGLHVKRYDGTSWLPLFDEPGVTDRIEWVDLLARSGVDEATLLFADATGRLSTLTLGATGLLAGTAQQLTGVLATRDWQGFAGAYESRSGDFLVVWGQPGLNETRYATRAPGVSFAATQRAPTLTTPSAIAAAADPMSDRIALAWVEGGCAPNTCDDFNVATWDGALFDSEQRLDGDIGTAHGRLGGMPVAVSFVGQTGQALAVHVNDLSTQVWARYATPSWKLIAGVPGWATGEAMSYQLFPLPGSSLVLGLVHENSGSLRAVRCDGASFSTGWLPDTGLLRAVGNQTGVPFAIGGR